MIRFLRKNKLTGWYVRRISNMFRFGVVGGSGTLLCLGLMYVLTSIVGLWYLLSYLICCGFMFLYSFSLNGRWTFKHKLED